MDPLEKANDVEAANMNSTKESLPKESLQEVVSNQEVADTIEQVAEPTQEVVGVATEQATDEIEQVEVTTEQQDVELIKPVVEAEPIAEIAEPVKETPQHTIDLNTFSREELIAH